MEKLVCNDPNCEKVGFYMNRVLVSGDEMIGCGRCFTKFCDEHQHCECGPNSHCHIRSKCGLAILKKQNNK